MFKKYTSIENSYRTEILERIKAQDFWTQTYVVQEKAHGANLSFWSTDGESFYPAKRTDNLQADERFFNHQLLLEKHLDKFRFIWQSVCDKIEDVSQVTIFGELVGGGYPHPDVPRVNDAIKVQKGVFYAPGNEFFAFDIQVNRETFLDIDYVVSCII